MKIIAHRGFWVDREDQNSLDAFKKALDMGFGIEIDVTTPIEQDIEIPRVFFGYDGTVLLTTKNLQLPWHAIEIDSSALQTLPSKLRKIPTQYNRVEELWYFLRVFGWTTFIKRVVLRLLRQV